MGHCSGAWYSLVGARTDERVVGVVALNPEPGTEDWTEYDRQRTLGQFYRNYYLRGALSSGNRWVRFLTGRVAYRSIARNVFRQIIGGTLATLRFRLVRRLGNWVPSPSQSEAASLSNDAATITRELVARGTWVLFVHPEGTTGSEFLDEIARDFPIETGEASLLRIRRLPGTDHMYTLLASQEALIALLQESLGTLVPSR
jgi:hypothetical protein